MSSKRNSSKKSTKVAEEIKWPAENRLTKPDDAWGAVWDHFRCEKLPEPRQLPNGQTALYTDYVYCLECKKNGKVRRTTWPVTSSIVVRVVLICSLGRHDFQHASSHEARSFRYLEEQRHGEHVRSLPRWLTQVHFEILA